MRTAPFARLALVLSAVALAAGCRGSSAGAAPSPSGGGPAAMATPPEVTPAAIAMGDSLFNNGSCVRCHARGGVGTQNAPPLNDNSWLQLKTGSYAEIVALITSGVPAAAIKDSTHRRAMNPRGGPMNLTDDQVKSVAAYVYSLSHKQGI